jgi:hypothetical protein
MKKIIWPYAFYDGFVAALIFGIFSTAVYWAGYNPFKESEFMFMPIYAVVMVAGMLWVRNQKNNGVLGGAHGITFGILAGITANMAYAVAVAVVLTAFPNVLENHVADLQAWMEEGKAGVVEHFGEEAYLQQKGMLAALAPKDIALDKLGKMSLLSFIVAVMSAMFCRKEKS